MSKVLPVEWSLNRKSFQLLLDWLSPDPPLAGERYESTRIRLLCMFENARVPDPDALADEVFDRVCRKLEAGAIDRTRSPAPYLFGVAANIIREARRRQAGQRRLADQIGTEVFGATPLPLHANGPAAEEAQQRKVAALRQCLAYVSTADIDLLCRYFEGSGRTRSQRRARLAKELGLSPGTLRVRVWRIRAGLAARISRKNE